MNGYEMVVFPDRMLALESKALICRQCCIHSALCTAEHIIGAPYLLEESIWEVGAVYLGQAAYIVTLKPCMQVRLMPPPVTYGLLISTQCGP